MAKIILFIKEMFPDVPWWLFLSVVIVAVWFQWLIMYAINLQLDQKPVSTKSEPSQPPTQNDSMLFSPGMP